jgi:hypothetical protein
MIYIIGGGAMPIIISPIVALLAKLVKKRTLPGTLLGSLLAQKMSVVTGLVVKVGGMKERLLPCYLWTLSDQSEVAIFGLQIPTHVATIFPYYPLQASAALRV